MKRILKNSATLITVGGLVLFFALLLWSLHNVISLDDGLRHFAMAKYMRAHGIAANTGWNVFLYHGVMSTLAVDPWFLYDILLIPLTNMQPDDALKLVSMIEIALIGSCFFLLLRTLRVPTHTEAWYVLALFLGDFQFMHRILLGRPFPLFTALGLLAIYCFFQKRWVLLGCTLFFATLLSHLFVFPLVISLLGILWLIFYRERTHALRAAFAIVIGIGAALILHPESMAYLTYLTAVFPLIPFQRQLALGSELGYSFFSDSRSAIVMIGLITLFFALFVAERKRIGHTETDRRIVFLVTLFVCLLPPYILWIRVIDLLWPVALLAVAALHAADPLLPGKARRKLLPSFVRPWFAPVILIAYFFLTAGLLSHLLIAQDPTRTLENFATLRAIPSQSRVLNVDWDLFPVYIALRPDLKYATGMDPTFTYLRDPKASELLHMVRGNAATFEPPILDASLWLKELTRRIPSDYLVLRRDRHRAFIETLTHVPSLLPVSASGAIAIFEIR